MARPKDSQWPGKTMDKGKQGGEAGGGDTFPGNLALRLLHKATKPRPAGDVITACYPLRASNVVEPCSMARHALRYTLHVKLISVNGYHRFRDVSCASVWSWKVPPQTIVDFCCKFRLCPP